MICVFTNYYTVSGKKGILRIIQTLSKLFLGIVYYLFEILCFQIENNQKNTKSIYESFKLKILLILPVIMNGITYLLDYISYNYNKPNLPSFWNLILL